MRRNETPEGKSVRLLRVGEQVRHIHAELLMRGDVVEGSVGHQRCSKRLRR